LQNGVDTASSGEYGKLTFDFSTGAYSYTTATATSNDRVESFEITVEDADGDTDTFNLKIQVYSSYAEYTYASATYDAGNGYDSLILGSTVNLDFSSVATLSNFEQIDLTQNGDHTLTNLTLANVFNMTDANNTLTILEDSGDSVSLSDTAGAWGSGVVSGATTTYTATYNDGNNDYTITLIETVI
jgi:hypothetical protein